MVGYLFTPAAGAATNNLTRHKSLAVVLYGIGVLAAVPILALVGVMMLGHLSLDRSIGYRLKYSDAFRHTDLGWIGRGD
jgi:hypothetical protein